MKQTAIALMSEEEYIEHEMVSESRHEYINGQLLEMPGEKDINNEIATDILVLLRSLLAGYKGYKVYTQAVKVAIPGGSKFRYPDVFVTAEIAQTENDSYVKREPVLIVEVVSKESRKTDYVDKLIEYTKIPTLQYYLIVEPEEVKVTVCEREGDDWISHQYASLEDAIQFPKLNAALSMTSIYKNSKR